MPVLPMIVSRWMRGDRLLLPCHTVRDGIAIEGTGAY